MPWPGFSPPRFPTPHLYSNFLHSNFLHSNFLHSNFLQSLLLSGQVASCPPDQLSEYDDELASILSDSSSVMAPQETLRQSLLPSASQSSASDIQLSVCCLMSFCIQRTHLHVFSCNYAYNYIITELLKCALHIAHCALQPNLLMRKSSPYHTKPQYTNIYTSLLMVTCVNFSNLLLACWYIF